MFRLNGDEIESSVEARPRDRAGRGGRVRLLRIWLWRWLGRACRSGLWTLSLDGKLGCESWRGEPERCE